MSYQHTWQLLAALCSFRMWVLPVQKKGKDLVKQNARNKDKKLFKIQTQNHGYIFLLMFVYVFLTAGCQRRL